MLWASLESRERLIVLALALVGFALLSAAAQQRRDEQLAERIARRLGA
jgi:hypothetical protein